MQGFGDSEIVEAGTERLGSGSELTDGDLARCCGDCLAGTGGPRVGHGLTEFILTDIELDRGHLEILD